MLRIRNISQASQQRTLRANYAQTQAYPYATYLAAYVYDATGAQGSAFSAGAGANPGVAGQGPIWPGMVAGLVPSAGQTVCVCVGGTVIKPWGLFGNFVGGDFDEVGDQTEVGVWKGPGAVFEVLSPAFNSNIGAADEATETDRLLYPDADGKLNDTAVSSGAAVARLLDWVSASKIIVELLV